MTEVVHAFDQEDLGMGGATFSEPGLTSFCRLDGLGLVVVGQRVEPGEAVLACEPVERDDWCRRCGCQGRVRDTLTRVLAHEPFGWRPTRLRVRLRRYRCTECGHVWRQDLSAAAAPRSRLSRRAVWWALGSLVIGHVSMSRVAAGLGVAWSTASKAVLTEARRLLVDDPDRFGGVRVLGVDEHCWRHTRKGGKWVTVVIDLAPVRDQTGPARLLDMVEGRSKAVLKDWPDARPQAWRDQVEVVAMDGFTGYKTATTENLPEAVAVMDPFHVVQLASGAVHQCRRRVQQTLHGHRGRTTDPLYRARQTLTTRTRFLTDKQKTRLDELLADNDHVEVEATWAVYQRLVAAYQHPSRATGKATIQALIDSLATGVPTALTEVRTPGRTLARRADDILAYFDRPHTTNGPTEAINGRLEHLRGTTLGFRSIDSYITRCLLKAGGPRPQLHPLL